MHGPVSGDLRELFRARPVGVAGDDPRHFDAARLAPAMGLAGLLEDLDLTPPDALLVVVDVWIEHTVRPRLKRSASAFRPRVRI
ncbi:MAG: hypothetical protein ACYS9X_31740, partial [Planctomycetota bacterium]